MVATSMAQLNAMLMNQLSKAMNVTSTKALADMYEETGKFYTGGSPKMYVRTGALGNTPETTPVTVSSFGSGGQASFEARLNSSGGYSTGKSPSMLAVLNLANYGSYPGLRPTVGKGGFWEAAEKKMERTLNQTLRMFFK